MYKVLQLCYYGSMSQTPLTIKIDTQVKADAQKLAKSLGLSLSSIVENKLREVVRDRWVIFEETPVPNAALGKQLREAKKDVKHNIHQSPAFDAAEEAIAYLHAQADRED